MFSEPKALWARGDRVWVGAAGGHDIVGKVNVTEVVRGGFGSAAKGYDAYDPHAGLGLLAEGLALVMNLAFAAETVDGMDPHRVAAAVPPGNVRSAALLRSWGFQCEGPYATAVAARSSCWSTACPAPARRLVRRLAAELSIPLFPQDVVNQSAADALWRSCRTRRPAGWLRAGSGATMHGPWSKGCNAVGRTRRRSPRPGASRLSRGVGTAVRGRRWLSIPAHGVGR